MPQLVKFAFPCVSDINEYLVEQFINGTSNIKVRKSFFIDEPTTSDEAGRLEVLNN